jgi:hypothetical protein
LIHPFTNHLSPKIKKLISFCGDGLFLQNIFLILVLPI